MLRNFLQSSAQASATLCRFISGLTNSRHPKEFFVRFGNRGPVGREGELESILSILRAFSIAVFHRRFFEQSFGFRHSDSSLRLRSSLNRCLFMNHSDQLNSSFNLLGSIGCAGNHTMPLNAEQYSMNTKFSVLILCMKAVKKALTITSYGAHWGSCKQINLFRQPFVGCCQSGC